MGSRRPPLSDGSRSRTPAGDSPGVLSRPSGANPYGPSVPFRAGVSGERRTVTAASATVRFIPAIGTRLVALVLAVAAATMLVVACHWNSATGPDLAGSGTGTAMALLGSATPAGAGAAERSAAARPAGHDVADDCSAAHPVAVADPVLTSAARPELPAESAASARAVRPGVAAMHSSLATDDVPLVRTPYLLCVLRT